MTALYLERRIASGYTPDIDLIQFVYMDNNHQKIIFCLSNNGKYVSSNFFQIKKVDSILIQSHYMFHHIMHDHLCKRHALDILIGRVV